MDQTRHASAQMFQRMQTVEQQQRFPANASGTGWTCMHETDWKFKRLRLSNVPAALERPYQQMIHRNGFVFSRWRGSGNCRWSIRAAREKLELFLDSSG